MNRRKMLQALGISALVPPLAVHAGAKSEPVFVLHPDFRSVFLSHPEKPNVREAVLSLVSHACLPFENHYFRGFIGQVESRRFMDGHDASELILSGVVFSVIPHFKGAIVFGRFSSMDKF